MSLLELAFPERFYDRDGRSSGLGPNIPLSADIEQNYPDLAHARNMFLRFMQQPDLFPQLGYTQAKARYAANISGVIEQDAVLHHKGTTPFLQFGDDRLGDPEFALNAAGRLYYFSENGIARSQFFVTSQDFTGTDPTKRPPDTTAFNDTTESIAEFTLFGPNAPLDSEKFLAEALLNSPVTDHVPGSTYEARWFNEKTKTILAAKVHRPNTHGGIDTEDYMFQRLEPLTDERGTYTPFGRRAAYTESWVTRILTMPGGTVVTGALQ